MKNFSLLTRTALAVLAVTGAPAGAAGLCTPGSVNPATVASLKPFTPLPAVIGLMGCAGEVVPSIPGLGPMVTDVLFVAGPGNLGELNAVFDKRGLLVSAVYLDPTGYSFVGGFRQVPPDPVLWQINEGVLPH